MTTATRCPVCDGQMPDRDQVRGGRKPRYCSGACKSKAYRERQQQAAGSPSADMAHLPPAARHARTIEIRQQVTELTAMLADAASGQQSLFASPGPARRVQPGEAGRTLHRLIAELTTLAAAAVATKRVTKRRPPAGVPQAPVLFDDTDPGDT